MHCSLNHKSAERSLVFLFLILAVWLTDAITLISKDEVEGSTVSKNEAKQVIPLFKPVWAVEETATVLHIWNEGDLKTVFLLTEAYFLLQFLVTEEKKEEAAAPPVEDTGDVDDLASVI